MPTHEALVSSEDCRVSGSQITGKKCGFASELWVWGNLELSVSAGSYSEWIRFYEMIVPEHTKCKNLPWLCRPRGAGLALPGSSSGCVAGREEESQPQMLKTEALVLAHR